MTFTFAKIFTNGIIGLAYHTLKNHELIYYNNLGFPSRELYTKAFLLDMFIWFVLLTLIFQL